MCSNNSNDCGTCGGGNGGGGSSSSSSSSSSGGGGGGSCGGGVVVLMVEMGFENRTTFPRSSSFLHSPHTK